MRKCKLLLILLSLCFLTTCEKVKQKDFYGDWIIDTAIYKGNLIPMATKTIKVYFLPTGFQNKFTLKFNPDSTIDFPGINTEDIPCKWKIDNGKLIIQFDTVRFRENALLQIDSLAKQTMFNHDSALKRKYVFKHDSILDIKNVNVLKVPIEIYSGIYTIQKTNDKLIIKSSTTTFQLINLQRALDKRINDMFDVLKKGIPHN